MAKRGGVARTVWVFLLLPYYEILRGREDGGVDGEVYQCTEGCEDDRMQCFDLKFMWQFIFSLRLNVKFIYCAVSRVLRDFHSFILSYLQSAISKFCIILHREGPTTIHGLVFYSRVCT